MIPRGRSSRPVNPPSAVAESATVLDSPAVSQSTYTVSLAESAVAGDSTSGTSGSSTAGITFSSLTVQAGTAGTYPYSATVLPLSGQVASGYSIRSADDPAMSSTILSTYADGSAAVAVVAGSTTVTLNQAKTLRLTTSAATDTALTTAAISALVTSVSVAFGSPYGTASVTSFGSPERIWWANSKVICARYRAAPPSGGTSLEAVIDIHAYSGRALVEVVVENGKMTTATPIKPASASYTAAVVAVNGSTVATVNGNLGPESNHAAFRSWYASTWIGGNPGLRVTQDFDDLQQHPFLWQMSRDNTADLSGYASDAYTPWSTGRQRATGMGGAGDHPSIGPLPQWEAKFLQTGDYRTANATEVSALACLGYNINYRDSGGAIPNFTQLKAISATQQAGWPSQTNGTEAMTWEVAHHPAVGLMAFACRPSPVYIELAQKAAVWNGTWSSSNDYGAPTATGVFGQYYQVRGKAWCLRTLAHAAFLTPDGDAWKTPAKTSISDNVTDMSRWITDGKYTLHAMCDDDVGHPQDHDSGVVGFQQAVWEHQYLTTEVHKAASIGLLTGASQTALNSLADWCALQPVTWVNDQTNGGWRYTPYKTGLGNNAVTINSAANWGAQRALDLSDSPPSVSGVWFQSGGEPTSYAGYVADSGAGALYPSYFWAALCAARERGVTGASTAFDTVQANITNLPTWLDGFASDPRWGPIPRSDTSAWDGGQADAYSGSQTFNTLQTAYNGISSSGGWATIPGTTLQTAFPSAAAIDAIAPVNVFRQPQWPNNMTVWAGAAWTGYSWFYTVAGAHLAGRTNDTYILRLADPVGPIRMHMPAPPRAVLRRSDFVLLDPSTWASQGVNVADANPEWGPYATHEYTGTIWDPQSKRVIFGGDAQRIVKNPKRIGSVVEWQYSVFVFNPYAPTPKRAWRRLNVPSTNDQAQGTGMLLNGDGTVSFRGLGVPERFTVDPVRRTVVSGAPLASPVLDQYQSYRPTARDPSTGKTYELAQTPFNASYGFHPTALYETTTGSYVQVAQLPSSFMTVTADMDYYSVILIVNGKAYVCGETAAAVGNTATLGVHQINLSTGAVVSFTTGGAVSVQELGGSGGTINGLHGRFAYVPEVNCFVALPSALANAVVFRPPSSWVI